MHRATFRLATGRLVEEGVSNGGPDRAEHDTFRCNHCQRTVVVDPKTPVDWDFCRNCMAPICGICAGKECDHFEKKLERHEARGRLLRDMGLGV